MAATLRCTIETGFVHRIDALLATGAFDVNEVLSDGWTHLHEACSRGRAETVRVLLEHGADPNLHAVFGLRETPLMLAMPFPSIVQRLLLWKHPNVEIDAQDADGTTALHRAMSNGETKTIDVLLKHGALFLARRGELTKSAAKRFGQ